MKNKQSSILMGILAIAILQFAVMNSHAQIFATNGNTVIINNFDTNATDIAYQVDDNNGFPWGNWFGDAFSNVVWSADDANPTNDDPGSGCMEIQSYFPYAIEPTSIGPQFVVWNGGTGGNFPFTPPFAGNGSLATNYVATNFSCDVRFVSPTTNFPTIEFGTVGSSGLTTNFQQYDFGTFASATASSNYVVDDFSQAGVGPQNPTSYDYYQSSNNYAAGQITNVWGQWFGTAIQSLSWDPTSNVSNSTPNFGSIKLNLWWTNNNQFALWDQGPHNNYYALNLNASAYTNFEADVRFAPGSASGTGNFGGGYPIFGHLRFGLRTFSYSQDWFGAVDIAATNTNWVHVNIPINASTDTNFLDVQGLAIGIDSSYYSLNLSGASTLWVDNIKFTGPTTIGGTNWTHVSIPITPNTNWAIIPNIYVKIYNNTLGSSTNIVPVFLHVDNIALQFGTVSNVSPTMSIQKPAGPGLRIFAGSTANTYDREQITSVDTNQSWVGGTYPVSYSFKLLDFPVAPTNQQGLFRFHIFLVPATGSYNTSGQGLNNNEYFEYQSQNNLWVNVTATTNGGVGNNVLAEVAWKTNLFNANPNNEVVSNFYSTAVGTWTLTFTSPTNGTLTPPVGSPASFTLPDAATITTDFGNPVAAFFGVQPDSGWGEGQYADVAQIQTAGVASPGVAINDNFATDTTLKTNIWNASNSANPNSVVLVTTNAAWWVYWTYPDIGFGLGTKADVGNTNIAWKTPNFYANYPTNSGPATPFTALEANNRWSLIPYNALPTVDGTSNGVTSTKAFFRLSYPGPAQ